MESTATLSSLDKSFSAARLVRGTAGVSMATAGLDALGSKSELELICAMCGICATCGRWPVWPMCAICSVSAMASDRMLARADVADGDCIAWI